VEAELKIFLDYSSKEYERETTREDEADFFSALQHVLGNDRVQQNESYHYISIPSFSTGILELVKKTARELRISISCGVEERLIKSELQRVRFARFTIQGDSIDHDSDGNPLNHFPSLLCRECNMPDESKLPGTFYVSAKKMLRRRQDGVPNVTLPTKREVFGCSCGVFVAVDRVKRILEVLEQPVICAPVAATPAAELTVPCWAIRPAHAWGRGKYLILSDPCPACRQPRRCHLDMEAEPEKLWPNRLILQGETIPDTDFVCCQTWFGDRTRRPSESFDFHRDVLVSGRLYALLLRAKVRGLMTPEEFVSFENTIPMTADKTTRAWVRLNLELLKSEGLLE
jgi:hypothetical protein